MSFSVFFFGAIWLNKQLYFKLQSNEFYSTHSELIDGLLFGLAMGCLTYAFRYTANRADLLTTSVLRTKLMYSVFYFLFIAVFLIFAGDFTTWFLMVENPSIADPNTGFDNPSQVVIFCAVLVMFEMFNSRGPLFILGNIGDERFSENMQIARNVALRVTIFVGALIVILDNADLIGLPLSIWFLMLLAIFYLTSSFILYRLEQKDDLAG